MLRQIIFVAILAFVAFFTYQQIAGNKTGFDINTEATFGATGKSGKKDVDERGHTEEFWTNNKFKW